MYFLPELNGKVSHARDVTFDDIELAEEVFCAQHRVGMDTSFKVFQELAKMIMEDEGLGFPSNPDEALQLYVDLLEHIEDIM